jgi:AcrR family transcriptional regulator
MYHYFPAKELVALAAIENFTSRDAAYLREHLTSAVTDTADVTARKNDPGSAPRVLADMTGASVFLLFTRRGGHALVRLLADPDVAASPRLMGATQDWLARLTAEVVRTLTSKPVKALGVTIPPAQARTTAVKMLTDAMGETLVTIGTVPPLQ